MLYLWLYIGIFIIIYVCVFKIMCMYVCIYNYVYVCVYVYNYVYVCIFFNQRKKAPVVTVMATLRSFPGIWVTPSSILKSPILNRSICQESFTLATEDLGSQRCHKEQSYPLCVPWPRTPCWAPPSVISPQLFLLGKKISCPESLSSSLGTRNTSLFILIHFWVSVLSLPDFQDKQSSRGQQ